MLPILISGALSMPLVREFFDIFPLHFALAACAWKGGKAIFSVKGRESADALPWMSLFRHLLHSWRASPGHRRRDRHRADPIDDHGELEPRHRCLLQLERDILPTPSTPVN